MKQKSTKELILETSQKLFLIHGYFGTSMDAISQELNITKAALYYHFDSKLEILETLMEPVIEKIKNSLPEKLLKYQEEPGFHSYIKTLLEYRTDYPILSLIMTMGVSTDDLRPASIFIKKVRENLLLVIEDNFSQQYTNMSDLANMVAKILVGIVFNPLLPVNTSVAQLTKSLARIISFNKKKLT